MRAVFRDFSWLSRWKRILVTGPQRSGTTVCAQMVAYDTGYEYLDENKFGVRVRSLFDQLLKRTEIVVQCPTMSRYIHEYGSDNVAIVFMLRDIDDIIRSQDRIGWRGEPYERKRYEFGVGKVAQVKYDFWYYCQRQQIPCAFEIEYESLRSHPLWVPGVLRQGFVGKQTRVK